MSMRGLQGIDLWCHRIKEAIDCLFALSRGDVFETTGDVGDHVSDIQVRQLADSSLPEHKDPLNWVAFRRIRGIEKDLVVVLLGDLHELGGHSSVSSTTRNGAKPRRKRNLH